MKLIDTDLSPNAWVHWTLLEAVTKAASKTLQKAVGTATPSWGGAFFASLIIGIVQVIVSTISLRKKNISAGAASKKHLHGAILYGIGALAATVLGFATFAAGGDMGVSTLIICLGVAPGAIIDQFWFKKSLGAKGWLGVIVSLFAGYIILGMPSLTALHTLPLWVGLAFLNMLAVVFNQVTTQVIKDIDPMVKNYWGGIVAIIGGGVGVVCSPSLNLDAIARIWPVSALIGLIVVAMWSFNVLSYRDGASIATKKVVLNGGFLTLAMIIGIVIYKEPLTWHKPVGAILFLLAFLLMQKKAK